MPQTIYMPQDPSGFGPMMSGGIESFGQAYLAKKKKEEEANKMLLSLLMEYGGRVDPGQMGQMEKAMGFGQSPAGKIGSMLGISGEPTPSPLRGIFDSTETGFKIKGKEERGLETFRKQKGIEEEFEIPKEARAEKRVIGAETRGEEKEKRMAGFKTEEEIRGELLKIDKLSGKQRQVKLDDLRAAAEVTEEMESKYFGSKLDRLKQEKTAAGDIAGAQAIELLQKELPLKWVETKKEIELKYEKEKELLTTKEKLRSGEETKKETKAAEKEVKRDYERTISAVNTGMKKLPGEEVSMEELENIKRIAEMYGFAVKPTLIPKSRIGVDWLAKDKYTFQIVDPTTGEIPKVYKEKTPTTQKTEEIKKPNYKYNIATGKLELVK